jgi:tetratricopeptide (TPR) repeat protein
VNWLEEEARATADNTGKARGLLACSELLATLGEPDAALALAEEARDAAPSLALAHRQARALVPSPRDPRARVAALDAEIKMTPAGPARLHSVLLAAEALRASGSDEEAGLRLDQAARLAPSDARAVVARATRALGRNEPTSPALKIPDARELLPISEAIGTCLRLRSPGTTTAKVKPSPSELATRARLALSKRDLAGAAPLVAQLAEVPELADGARWLAAALGAASRTRRAESVTWLQELADGGDGDAHRALVTRALELGDRQLLTAGLSRAGQLTSQDRVTLATLVGLDVSPTDPHLAATAEIDEMRPLACAVTALAMPTDGADRAAQVRARAERTAGSVESRSLAGLGRLLAAAAAPAEVEALIGSLGTTTSAGARAVALEMAARAGRASEVSDTLAAWAKSRETADDRTIGALGAALVAEQGGDQEKALHAYKAARTADPTCEAALRAIASLEQVDMVAEMNALADELGDGVRGAVARLEAVTLGDEILPDPTKAQLLESAHRAAPALPIAAFLAERIARRTGDVDEALRWVRERRANSADPTETALDAIREALFVGDSDPALAEERLREAHQVRPADVALRELYERMATSALDDRARWREERARTTTGNASILAYLDAANEYERTGDDGGALRCAEAAAATEAPLGRVARERAELRTSRVARLSDELITQAKGTEDARSRLEAFERLAALDATAGNDPASALLWHRSILEEQPHYKPSLRHVEQHLVGEGRHEELEPVMSAIAGALRSTGSAECVAHAEAAARLRMRGVAGSWESTSDVVELAAAEAEPSLWSLRMLQAHARMRGDDATFLSVTKRLVERAPRPAEGATLVAQAGEAAARLGLFEEARALLDRACVEDPGDVATWRILADICGRAGDARGAAEACESLARSSGVDEHRLSAWHEAATIWLDEAGDEDRGVSALETAAAIDVARGDIFDRLSSLYAARKMQPELADLLERRIDCVTDPDERLAIEIRRGRVLFEVGDIAGARGAFQSALQEHPDDSGALTAYTDFCLAQGEWDLAETSLIQLARLLPTPEEQRDVYARLGELYSNHLLNLSRAEVALKEVLKRTPDDMETAVKLVRIYARQNDPARAIELQQELVMKATTPEEKRDRVIELSSIHEQVGHDNRRAEQTLESGRREFPQDVALLRALAEFYQRHRQTPAFNILLDRAGADARRALAAGRLLPASFEVLAAAFELRGRTDAARVTQAMLATLEGRPAELRGAGAERALDPTLDELLAPDAMTPAMRSLLAKTGEVLDAVTAVDLRALKAVPIAQDGPVARLVARVAAAAGMNGVQLLSSPKLGAVCIPVGSAPPTLVMGESLVADERIGGFLALRALKLVRVKASALGRTIPGELGVLVSAWLKCFNPTWQAQGINPAALNAAIGRMQASVPRNLPPDVGVLALEVAGSIGTRQATLGPGALVWANRAAFLALGDPGAALDAIAAAGSAASTNPTREAPRDPKERAAWVARTPEARDLIAFGVADAFAEARTGVGLDRPTTAR